MYSRHELEMHADQLDQMAGRDGDAFDTAAKMLRQCARSMPQASEPAWQQKLQAEQARLGLMPDISIPYNVQNVGSGDGPASEGDYALDVPGTRRQ